MACMKWKKIRIKESQDVPGHILTETHQKFLVSVTRTFLSGWSASYSKDGVIAGRFKRKISYVAHIDFRLDPEFRGHGNWHIYACFKRLRDAKRWAVDSYLNQMLEWRKRTDREDQTKIDEATKRFIEEDGDDDAYPT